LGFRVITAFISGVMKLGKIYIICGMNDSEGKAIPLKAWTGPEGSWSLRFPDLKTIGA
jgi:hypothetical protein